MWKVVERLINCVTCKECAKGREIHKLKLDYRMMIADTEFPS